MILHHNDCRAPAISKHQHCQFYEIIAYCTSLSVAPCSFYTVLHPSMPSQKRKDDDLVPKDAPERPAKRFRGEAPVIPPPNDMPAWEPLPINNNLEYGKPNLPHGVNRDNPIELFKLFFTDEWLTMIAERTNANAKRIINEEKNSDFRRPRSWHPVDKYDMMRYLAAVIHMGIHREAEITNY